MRYDEHCEVHSMHDFDEEIGTGMIEQLCNGHCQRRIESFQVMLSSELAVSITHEEILVNPRLGNPTEAHSLSLQTDVSWMEHCFSMNVLSHDIAAYPLV